MEDTAKHLRSMTTLGSTVKLALLQNEASDEHARWLLLFWIELQFVFLFAAHYIENRAEHG